MVLAALALCGGVGAVLLGAAIAQRHLVGTLRGAVIAAVCTLLMLAVIHVSRARAATANHQPAPGRFGSVTLAVLLFFGIGGVARTLLLLWPSGAAEGGPTGAVLCVVAAVGWLVHLVRSRRAG